MKVASLVGGGDDLEIHVVDVDVENNLLLIKGAIPGAKNGLVSIRKTVKTGKLRAEQAD